MAVNGIELLIGLENLMMRQDQEAREAEKFKLTKQAMEREQQLAQLMGLSAQNAQTPEQLAQYQEEYVGDVGGAFDISNPEDRALIQQEAGVNLPQAPIQNQIQAMLGTALTQQSPEALDKAKTLATMLGTVDTSSNERSVFGQQLRGLGTDLLFISQNYGGGKIPQNREELEEMTIAAANDPEYGEKRQEWANDKTSGRFSVEGVSADDPSSLIITDTKRGQQVTTKSQGDALNQTLSNATDDQIKSLETYRDLYDVGGELEALYDESLVGLFDGNIEAFKSRFVGTPEYTKFKNVADRLRTIVYGFSGKQINETELEWLTGILPQLYNPDENFLAKLESIKDWVADKQAAQLIEMRNARRYSSTKPLKEDSGTDPAKLRAMQKEVDARIKEQEETAQKVKRIRIKIGSN